MDDEKELIRCSVAVNSEASAADFKTYKVDYYNLDVIIAQLVVTSTRRI